MALMAPPWHKAGPNAAVTMEAAGEAAVEQEEAKKAADRKAAAAAAVEKAVAAKTAAADKKKRKRQRKKEQVVREKKLSEPAAVEKKSANKASGNKFESSVHRHFSTRLRQGTFAPELDKTPSPPQPPRELQLTS